MSIWDPSTEWNGNPKAIVFTDFDGTITLRDSEFFHVYDYHSKFIIR